MDGEVILTADDIVRAGACREGVARVLRRLTQFAGTIAAAMPVSAILRLLAEDERGYVTRAAQLDGDGYGYYGDGFGYVYGDGSGDGDGNGHGYGHGDGNGDGYAYAEGR